MPRAAFPLAALALVLGFLVGDSLTGQEPKAASDLVQPLVAPANAASPHHSVPYADSPQPVRLSIPALNVAADIRPVGMSDDRTMQVPTDIQVVGWFDRSVLPISNSGNTVLVGHRDGASDPNGVFRNLGDVGKDDRITVSDQAGRTIEYTVAKVDLLTDEVFARRAQRIFRTSGPHQLILITCGGPYDATRGGYQANVIVVAKRA